MGTIVDLRAFRGTGDLYFIRHGESEGNRDGVIQGRSHSRLTDRGLAQAREAGAWFKNRPLDIILTSPLARASETARLIAEVTGVREVTVVEELTEIDTGIFSDLTFAEAKEMHPAVWKDFQRESWEAVPDAERIDELLERAGRAWNRLVDLFHRGRKSVLSVTHSGFLQWIIRSTLGSRSWMPLLSTSDNCCVSYLRVSNGEVGPGEPEGVLRPHFATWLLVNAPISGSSA